MWSSKIFPFLLLYFLQATSATPRDCCSEPNVLGITTCVNGNDTILKCVKYIVPAENNETLKFNGDSFLFDEGTEIPRDRYCVSETRDGTPAVLICSDGGDSEPLHQVAPRTICSFISVFFLTLTIIVYVLVSELRDLQGECTLQSIAGLAASFLGVGVLQHYLPWVLCHPMSLFVYFSFLYAFFWLNVLSFHIWRSVVKPHMLGTEKQWRSIYYFYGVGMPVLFLIILLAADNIPGNHIKPRMAETKCWFEGKKATYLYFYGPIATILSVNMILFVWTSITLWKKIPHEQNNKLKVMRYKCSLYIKLFFIMGLSWIFEVLSYTFEGHGKVIEYLWMITDYVNALQGILIFVLLVVTRKRALKGLAKRGLCCIKLPASWNALQDDESIINDEEVTRLSNAKV